VDMDVWIAEQNDVFIRTYAYILFMVD